MDYKMDDSIGQNKCLGDKCPNHCCSEKYVGLNACLEYSNNKALGEPLLDDAEYKRIHEFSGNEYINIINGKPYLKVLPNNSCSAFKDGKCMIYDVRPDACKIYPFYFDQAYGLCKDKNCPGNFTTDDITSEHFELIKKRINLYQKELEGKRQ